MVTSGNLTLLLAFFFRHLPELIKRGHVYIAQPPLFKIKAGKETHWAKDDVQKEQVIGKLRKGTKFEVSRFKGLGEMDPDVLKTTTVDANSRTLLKVEIDSLLDTDPGHTFRRFRRISPPRAPPVAVECTRPLRLRA